MADQRYTYVTGIHSVVWDSEYRFGYLNIERVLEISVTLAGHMIFHIVDAQRTITVYLWFCGTAAYDRSPPFLMVELNEEMTRPRKKRMPDVVTAVNARETY